MNQRHALNLFNFSKNYYSNVATKTLKDFMPSTIGDIPTSPSVTYIQDIISPLQRKVYIETYGCQMNVNDTEIVLSILQKFNYVRTVKTDDADVALLMTCAIRDQAENRVWERLHSLKHQKPQMKIAVLGCMAERLKSQLLEKKKLVDVVCGPDAYRDLPRLLEDMDLYGKQGMNVMLSLEETYADVKPVRFDEKSPKAFVSIMRGCDNMCSYCIVPFTRGRERSRDMESIIDEVGFLVDKGVKEITLLGQNVNSYRDVSNDSEENINGETQLSKGFSTIYKPKVGGRRFHHLLDQVSLKYPNVRFRFTSPHPKDFPDDLLYLIKERNNICKMLHIPAQSGSSKMLEKMRRGYTRQSYLELVDKIKSIIPDVALSSDFISGFCGETNQDHLDTISLMETVKYDMAYMFAYSLREKTHAHRNYVDDVPEQVKKERLNQLISTFKNIIREKTKKFIGTEQLVLIEGDSRKSNEYFSGHSDQNYSAVIKKNQDTKNVKVGDFVQCKVVDTSEKTLICDFINLSSITEFNRTT